LVLCAFSYFLKNEKMMKIMEEQGEDEVVQSNNPVNPSAQCRCMASNSNTNEKTERCSYHRWQRSILGISWKDRVTNEEVRVRTGHHSMDDILSERRLRWLGHLMRMDHQRIPRHSTGVAL